MMGPLTGRTPNLGQRKELLRDIYAVYGRWVERFPLACSKGCSACCTRSVTMTSQEGELILEHVRKAGKEKWFSERLALAPAGKGRPGMTMNQFAEACLNQREIGGEMEGNWDFRACVFLENQSCTIYAARPFGCRSFGSLTRCTPGQEAEVAPIHLTVNTVFTQIIEHICSSSGSWSIMTDILHDLSGRKSCRESPYLPAARPLPGFLLEPREVRVVRELLLELGNRLSGQEVIGDLIDNFLLIE